MELKLSHLDKVSFFYSEESHLSRRSRRIDTIGIKRMGTLQEERRRSSNFHKLPNDAAKNIQTIENKPNFKRSSGLPKLSQSGYSADKVSGSLSLSPDPMIEARRNVSSPIH